MGAALVATGARGYGIVNDGIYTTCSSTGAPLLASASNINCAPHALTNSAPPALAAFLATHAEVNDTQNRIMWKPRLDANGGCKLNITVCRYDAEQTRPDEAAAPPNVPDISLLKEVCKSKLCISGPCAFLEVDYQNYNLRNVNPESEFSLFGRTHCGPVFGRGYTNRLAGNPTVTQVATSDSKYYPGVSAGATQGYAMIDSTDDPTVDEWKPLYDRVGSCKIATQEIANLLRVQEDTRIRALAVAAIGPADAIDQCARTVGLDALADYYFMMAWSSDPMWQGSAAQANFVSGLPTRILDPDILNKEMWCPWAGSKSNPCLAQICTQKASSTSISTADLIWGVCNRFNAKMNPKGFTTIDSDTYKLCEPHCVLFSSYPTSDTFPLLLQTRTNESSKGIYVASDVYWADVPIIMENVGCAISDNTSQKLLILKATGNGKIAVEFSELLSGKTALALDLFGLKGYVLDLTQHSIQRLIFIMRYLMCTPNAEFFEKICPGGATTQQITAYYQSRTNPSDTHPVTFDVASEYCRTPENFFGRIGMVQSCVDNDGYDNEFSCSVMPPFALSIVNAGIDFGNGPWRPPQPEDTDQTKGTVPYQWICYLTSSCSWAKTQEVVALTAPAAVTLDVGSGLGEPDPMVDIADDQFSMVVYQRPESLLDGRDRMRSGNLPVFPTGRTVEDDSLVLECSDGTHNMKKYGYHQIQVEGFKEFTMVACAIFGYCSGANHTYTPWTTYFNATVAHFPIGCCICAPAKYMAPVTGTQAARFLEGHTVPVPSDKVPLFYCYQHQSEVFQNKKITGPCVNNAYTPIWYSANADEILADCCPWWPLGDSTPSPDAPPPAWSNCLMRAPNISGTPSCQTPGSVTFTSNLPELLRSDTTNGDVPIDQDMRVTLKGQLGTFGRSTGPGGDLLPLTRTVVLSLGSATDTLTAITLAGDITLDQFRFDDGDGSADSAGSVADWILASARGTDVTDPCNRRIGAIQVGMQCEYGAPPTPATRGAKGAPNIGVGCTVTVEAEWDGIQPEPTGCSAFTVSANSVDKTAALYQRNNKAAGGDDGVPSHQFCEVPGDGVGFKAQNPCDPAVTISECHIEKGIFNIATASIYQDDAKSLCIRMDRDQHEKPYKLTKTDKDATSDGKVIGRFACGYKQNFEYNGLRPTKVAKVHEMHDQELGNPNCWAKISNTGVPKHDKYKHLARWEPLEMFRWCTDSGTIGPIYPDNTYRSIYTFGGGDALDQFWTATFKDYTVPDNRTVVFAKCCADREFMMSVIDGRPQIEYKKGDNDDYNKNYNIQWGTEVQYNAGGGSCSTSVPEIAKPFKQYTDKQHGADYSKYMRAGGSNSGGEVQFIVENLAWNSISSAPTDGPVSPVNLDGTLSTALLDTLSDGTLLTAPLNAKAQVKNAPPVPADYSGTPYYTNTKSQDSAFACDCKQATPIFECERHTPQAMNALYPGRNWSSDSMHGIQSGVSFVRCSWGWDNDVGLAEAVGLFIPSVQSSSRYGFNVIERDWLAKEGAASMLEKTYLDPLAPSQERLEVLINSQGGNGSDFAGNLGYQGPDVKLPVYRTLFRSGACIRWPYGRVHRHFLKTPAKYFSMEGGVNGGLTPLATEAMYAYCEKLDGNKKFVYCNHDEYSAQDREYFCSQHPEALSFTLGIGIDIRNADDVCALTSDGVTTICVFVMGDRNWLSPTALFELHGRPNTVVIIAPFSMRAAAGVQSAVHTLPLVGPAAVKAFARLSNAMFFGNNTRRGTSDTTGIVQIERDQFLAFSALGTLARAVGDNFTVDYVIARLTETRAAMHTFSAAAADLAVRAGSAGCTGGVYLGISNRLDRSTIEHWDRYVCGDDTDLMPVSGRGVQMNHPGQTLISGDEQLISFVPVAGPIGCRAVTIQAPGATVGPIEIDNTECTITGHRSIPVVLGPGGCQNATVDIRAVGGASPVVIAAIGFDESYPDMGDAVSQIDGGAFTVAYNGTAVDPASIFAEFAFLRANGSIAVSCSQRERSAANSTYAINSTNCTVLVQDYSPRIAVQAESASEYAPDVINVSALTGVFGYGFEHTALQIRGSKRSHADLVAAIVFTVTAIGVFAA